MLAAGLLGQGATDETNTAARVSTLPPIGIGSAETAQVLVANNATSASPDGTAPSCGGTISFYNASGAPIGSVASFTLGAGQIASASLSYTAAAVTTPRALVRAVVSLTVSLPGAPCLLTYSLSTFDNTTGATHAIVTDSGLPTGVLPLPHTRS
jgi:hypothetical protein